MSDEQTLKVVRECTLAIARRIDQEQVDGRTSIILSAAIAKALIVTALTTLTPRHNWARGLCQVVDAIRKDGLETIAECLKETKQ